MLLQNSEELALIIHNVSVRVCPFMDSDMVVTKIVFYIYNFFLTVPFTFIDAIVYIGSY